MLRDSGLPNRHLVPRGWPRYDAMRTELAVGQFADLAIDVRELPTLEAVLEVARRSRELHGAPALGDRRGNGRLRRAGAGRAR